jgi:hypothetical protein
VSFMCLLKETKVTYNSLANVCMKLLVMAGMTISSKAKFASVC